MVYFIRLTSYIFLYHRKVKKRIPLGTPEPKYAEVFQNVQEGGCYPSMCWDGGGTYVIYISWKWVNGVRTSILFFLSPDLVAVVFFLHCNSYFRDPNSAIQLCTDAFSVVVD